MVSSLGRNSSLVLAVACAFSLLAACGAKNTPSSNSVAVDSIGLQESDFLSETESAQVMRNVGCTAINSGSNSQSACSFSGGFELAPRQEKFSRFDVKYEVSCGEAGFLSPLALQTEQQRRAFVYASNTTVSVFGMGPVVLGHRRVPKTQVKYLNAGCKLSAEVIAVTSVDSLSQGVPGSSAIAE